MMSNRLVPTEVHYMEKNVFYVKMYIFLHTIFSQGQLWCFVMPVKSAGKMCFGIDRL